MRLRTLITSLLLTLVAATPALAQSGFYLSAFAGTQYLEDSKLRAAGVRDINVEFDWGSHAGFSLGYNTGRQFSTRDNVTGRLEVEFAVRNNDVDAIEVNQRFEPRGGEMKVTSLMANSWIDIRTNTPFVPFFGIGLGAARLNFDNAGFADDSDTRFAYQIGAGVGLPVGRHLNFDLGYRYFATLDPTFTDPDGVRNEVDYATHNLTFGVRLGF
ncbi:outer membrane protein [Geoalkalibacter sp.]|uniref:outer membrane protein n=1 Tax=Geoalkalibacter sp. TaxID=3041440 RepID=UPI00272E55EC|nr:outer membrane beta-barrel protein [Geoalkalibacter sp.]